MIIVVVKNRHNFSRTRTKRRACRWAQIYPIPSSIDNSLINKNAAIQDCDWILLVQGYGLVDFWKEFESPEKASRLCVFAFKEGQRLILFFLRPCRQKLKALHRITWRISLPYKMEILEKAWSCWRMKWWGKSRGWLTLISVVLNFLKYSSNHLGHSISNWA